jgi:hypothetical protein
MDPITSLRLPSLKASSITNIFLGLIFRTKVGTFSGSRNKMKKYEIRKDEFLKTFQNDAYRKHGSLHFNQLVLRILGTKVHRINGRPGYFFVYGRETSSMEFQVLLGNRYYSVKSGGL